MRWIVTPGTLPFFSPFELRGRAKRIVIEATATCRTLRQRELSSAGKAHNHGPIVTPGVWLAFLAAAMKRTGTGLHRVIHDRTARLCLPIDVCFLSKSDLIAARPRNDAKGHKQTCLGVHTLSNLGSLACLNETRTRLIEMIP